MAAISRIDRLTLGRVRVLLPAGGLVATLTALLAISIAADASGATGVRAHAARTLTARDSARLRYVSASGSLLYETGSAHGTLPGSMRAHVNIGATISGNFTIYARGGSISGHGAAAPKGNGVWESFAGSLTVTGGSGRYAHARGKAHLYGTFNRNTYALVVQTVGTLRY